MIESASVGWMFLQGLLLSIAIECPIVFIGLSQHQTRLRRIAIGIWLTLCTYPIIFFALPPLLYEHVPYWLFVLVGEAIVITIECGLYATVTGSHSGRELGVIVLANLASIAAGIRWYVF